MTIVFYPAIVERDQQAYGVVFPDLPGCVSVGATAQEAAVNAEEALSGHLAVMLEHGDDPPPPSDIDAIAAEPDAVEVARLLVRGERPGRAVRVQVTLEDGLLARIDRVAPDRSRFLADAARAALAARG